MKALLDIIRYSAAAPFSRAYAAKKRWLRESGEWEALGVAQTDMRRKVYVVPRTGSICISVSKCANTTLKYMLYPESMTDEDGAHDNDYMLTRLVDVGMTLNNLLDRSQRVFTFVRHPVARFWSCYLAQIPDPGSTTGTKIVSDISRHFGIEARQDYPPELVLDYIKSTSPVIIDEHIRPLWSCTGIERLPIDFIGRVESMKEDVAELLDKGYFDEGHIKRFRHLNRSNAPEYADKARIDRIIRDVYAKDMEAFGYE